MNLLINCNAKNIPLADGSVHCVVTSPPYYGLRDYGTAKWEGGDPNCDHKKPFIPRNDRRKAGCKLHKASDEALNAYQPVYHEVCGKCGAIRIDAQLGLEQTPAEYVNDIVQVFREVWRILRDDGTVWLNLGDSYNGSGGAGGDYIEGGLKEGQPKYPGRHINNLKLKDLIGIPWMVAFALRDDGWYLRQDIIWHKPNPMPESVKDRCTKAHEYIFLLSKSAKYYYDNEAVKEPANYPNDDRKARAKEEHKSMPDGLRNGLRPGNYDYDMTSRNKRDVWTVTTKPYKGAHYATFPPELITPCILAGAPEDGIVFDPFVGSGTTVMVANHLGRKGIGLDLNFKYLKDNAKERIATVQPIMFN